MHNSFLKNVFVAAYSQLDNTKKISNLLLFQLKENQFSALAILGAIIDLQKLRSTST